MFATNSMKRDDIVYGVFITGVVCFVIMYTLYQKQKNQISRILTISDNREAILLGTLDVVMDDMNTAKKKSEPKT